MNVCEITRLSQYAARRLQPGTTGTVHSAYEKSVNLRVPDGLVCVQAAGTAQSPLTLTARLSPAALAALALEPGMDMTVRGSMLCFGNGVQLFFARAERTAHTLRPLLQPERLAELQDARGWTRACQRLVTGGNGGLAANGGRAAAFLCTDAFAAAAVGACGRSAGRAAGTWDRTDPKRRRFFVRHACRKHSGRTAAGTVLFGASCRNRCRTVTDKRHQCRFFAVCAGWTVQRTRSCADKAGAGGGPDRGIVFKNRAQLRL